MVMLINEQDIRDLENFASLTAAIKLSVKDPEFMSIEDRVKIIESKNQNLFNYLNSFLKAFRNWFLFHKNVDLQNKQGKLSPEETTELTKLIDEKDKARTNYLQLMASLDK